MKGPRNAGAFHVIISILLCGIVFKGDSMTPLKNFKHSSYGLSISVGILLIALVAGGFYFTRERESEDDSLNFYRVLHVIDGDTILVLIDGTSERVRLIGINTPETKGVNTRDECFGLEASDRTNIMLARKEVRLLGDSLNDDRDKFGRLLRYVYLPDDTLINEELVRSGFATLYRGAEFEKQDLFLRLESQARALGIGLWGACFPR